MEAISNILPLLNNSRESERSFYLQSERPFIFHSEENTTGQSGPKQRALSVAIQDAGWYVFQNTPARCLS
jgi:hypothetical protein